MKTIVYLLFFITISTHIYGQAVKDKINDWKIGVKYAFDNSSSSTTISNSQYIGYSLNFDSFNYTTGISLEKIVVNRFSILSGLEYSNKDFTATFFCDVCKFIIAPLPESYQLRFLQIPLNIKYRHTINSFSLFVLSGITNSFTVKKELNENNYLLNGNFGIGIGYRSKDKWIFELSSEYNKSITKLYADASYDQKYTGIIIGIKKEL